MRGVSPVLGVLLVVGLTITFSAVVVVETKPQAQDEGVPSRIVVEEKKQSGDITLRLVKNSGGKTVSIKKNGSLVGELKVVGDTYTVSGPTSVSVVADDTLLQKYRLTTSGGPSYVTLTDDFDDGKIGSKWKAIPNNGSITEIDSNSLIRFKGGPSKDDRPYLRTTNKLHGSEKFDIWINTTARINDGTDPDEQEIKHVPVWGGKTKGIYASPVNGIVSRWTSDDGRVILSKYEGGTRTELARTSQSLPVGTFASYKTYLVGNSSDATITTYIDGTEVLQVTNFTFSEKANSSYPILA